MDRRLLGYPMHSPVHISSERTNYYHITAACYEHQPIIGLSMERLVCFSVALLQGVAQWRQGVVVKGSRDCGSPVKAETGGIDCGGRAWVSAWVVLPNHYHLLVACDDILGLLKDLGRLHGRTAFLWNKEDGRRGRQVWCKAAETAMKSDRHACVTMNYIHNNPVKHGVCEKWQAWPFSSAVVWLENVGHEAATAFWMDYPVKDYGKLWDV